MINICVPSPKTSLSYILSPGAAIVTVECHNKINAAFRNEPCLAYSEASNSRIKDLRSFCRHVVKSAGQLHTCSNGPEKVKVPDHNLIVVGTYDPEFNLIQLSRPDLVKMWIEQTGIYNKNLKKPHAVRLVLDVVYECNSSSEDDLSNRLIGAIESEVSYGALTESTDAEVEGWKLTVL